VIIAEQRMLSIANRPLRIRWRYVAERPAPLDGGRRSSGGREGHALSGIIAAGLSGSFGVSRVPFASVE